MASAPPRQQIRALATMYGSVASGNVNSRLNFGKARLWLLLDDDDAGSLMIITNRPRPSRGQVERLDAGKVNTVTVVNTARPKRWEVELASGERLIATSAPCVCGAGRAGHAAPVDGPHTISMARPDTVSWAVTA